MAKIRKPLTPQEEREWLALVERLKSLSRELGISLKRIPNALNILKGKSQRPQLDTLRKIAIAMGVPLERVTGERPHMPGIVGVPYISCVDIGSGAPLSEVDNQPRLMLPMPVLYGLSVEHLRALEASSDAMEPEIRAGDIVLVDLSSRDTAGGGIFLIHDSAGFGIYRVMPLVGSGRLQLLSDSGRYPTQEVAADAVTIVGRAVRSIRNL